MNAQNNQWQDREYVLKWFGVKEGEAKNPTEICKKRCGAWKKVDSHRRRVNPSMGGWSAVRAMRKTGTKVKSDDRILGSGTFVAEVMNQAEKKIKHQLSALDMDKRITEEIEMHCKQKEIDVSILRSGSRRNPLPQLRKTLALKLVNEYGVSLAETARQLGLSTSGIAQILKRNKFV